MNAVSSNPKQPFNRSYIPPNRRRCKPIPPKKLVLDDESFPALPGNHPNVNKLNCIGSFAKAVQLETTSTVETKSTHTVVNEIFQTNIGRQIEENHRHDLWKRLTREDVQPRILDDPNHARYIHVYQVNYEKTFNQEEESVSSEDTEEEETDVEEEYGTIGRFDSV